MGTIQEEEETIESSYVIHLNKGIIIYANEKRHQCLVTPDTELKIKITFSLFLGLVVKQVAAILQLLASAGQVWPSMVPLDSTSRVTVLFIRVFRKICILAWSPR